MKKHDRSMVDVLLAACDSALTVRDDMMRVHNEAMKVGDSAQAVASLDRAFDALDVALRALEAVERADTSGRAHRAAQLTQLAALDDATLARLRLRRVVRQPPPERTAPDPAPSSGPTRETIERELDEAAADLGDDELRVIVTLARRLLEGQARYGRIDLATDIRDFRKERAAEVADLLVYTAFIELSAAARDNQGSVT